MPVLDHPTHEKTIGGDLYGCHNKTRKRRCYWAKDGYHGDGRQNFVIVTHAMSVQCRYDQSMTDPKCSECKHAGSGEKYADGVRLNGA